ncbi:MULTISPECIES: molecular chaperone TorD family protein [unclassified Methylobacterium]|uniref:TorD/DmsD family molecular chaperone n=1 Tax=unclassified Methylobacterium TaxID=2615210 RepID=UPI0009E89A84|nr:MULTISPECIES: molecular chaperone TorD family protein [unclassified Methylobacterium]
MRSGDTVQDRVGDVAGRDAAFGVIGDVSPVIDEIDRSRADQYDLLAVLLGRSPSPDLLSALAGLRGDATPLGRAVTDLAKAAGEADLRAVQREYFDLFVGVGRGELVPFASYYLTGFLNERPLARLREDLRRLGVEPTGGMSEPEDHIAIVMEIMAGLCGGRLGDEAGADRDFFARHVEPWAARFFRDVAQAQASRFYRAVGTLGATYIDIEAEAFGLDGAS